MLLGNLFSSKNPLTPKTLSLGYAPDRLPRANCSSSQRLISSLPENKILAVAGQFQEQVKDNWRLRLHLKAELHIVSALIASIGTACEKASFFAHDPIAMIAAMPSSTKANIDLGICCNDFNRDFFSRGTVQESIL